MAWDFTADSDIQRSMSKVMNEKAESLDGAFERMYGEIDNLGAYWIGKDYDLFASGCAGYKTALTDLSSSMKLYAGHFENIATGTDELATSLIGIVDSILNYCGGSGGTGGLGGPDGSGNPDGTPDGEDLQNGVVDPEGADTEEKGYWAKLGDRYVKDWNDLASDHSDAWSGTDGLFSGVWSIVESVLDVGAFAVSGTVDTVQSATDMLQTAWNWCFDLGDNRSVQNSSYWQNVGQDYLENFDYSTCDNFGEGVGKFFCDTLLGSVLDTVQLAGNIVVDGTNVVLEAGDWLVEGVTDVVGTIGNWLFG